MLAACNFINFPSNDAYENIPNSNPGFIFFITGDCETNEKQKADKKVRNGSTNCKTGSAGREEDSVPTV